MSASHFLRRLRKDQSGAAGIIVAGSAFALMGAASIAVDLGSIYLAKRQLQGVADAAAMSAAANVTQDDAGFAAAQALIDHTSDAGVRIRRVTPGSYVRDPKVTPDKRFTPGASNPSAARVTVEQDVPLFFARVLVGKNTTRISARATAAQMDLAAFSLGTRLTSLSGSLPVQLLNALAGTDLGLSNLDASTLAAAPVGILNLGDALRNRLGLTNANYDQVFNQEIPLDTLVSAMADAAPDSQSKALLEGVSSKVGSQSIKLSDIVDLGPLGGTDYNDGKSGLSIDVMSLLKASLEWSQGPTYDVSFSTNVAGVASTTVRIAGGNAEVHSPLLTITAAKDVVLRTGQARIYVDATVDTGLTLLPQLHLPIYTELADAEARISSINCHAPDPVGVTLAVTPSIGSAAIGDIDQSQFDNFSSAMPIAKTTLASALGTTVQGYSDLSLGGASAQSVFFNQDEIAAHVTKTVATDDLVTALASSLVSKMDLSVSTPLGPLASPNVITSGLGSTLGIVAPALDGLLNNVTQTLGIPLGLADVRVDRMRCGMPLLV